MPESNIEYRYTLRIYPVGEGDNEGVLALQTPEGEIRTLGAEFTHQIPEEPYLGTDAEGMSQPRGSARGTVLAPTSGCRLEPDGEEHVHILWFISEPDGALRLSCLKRRPWHPKEGMPNNEAEEDQPKYPRYASNGLPEPQDKHPLAREQTGYTTLGRQRLDLMGLRESLEYLPKLCEAREILSRSSEDDIPSEIPELLDFLKEQESWPRRLLDREAALLLASLMFGDDERARILRMVTIEGGDGNNAFAADPPQPEPEDWDRPPRLAALAVLDQALSALPQRVHDHLSTYLPEIPDTGGARQLLEKLDNDVRNKEAAMERYKLQWHHYFDEARALPRIYLVPARDAVPLTATDHGLHQQNPR